MWRNTPLLESNFNLNNSLRFENEQMDRFIKVERVLGDKAMLQVDWNRGYETSLHVMEVDMSFVWAI